MADEDRKTEDPVELLQQLFQQLEREPYAFDFFQVLRRLECLHPDLPRIGASTTPREDPIRLGQEPSLAFAPSTLAALQSSGLGLPRLLVHFFGVFGANGPLPLHLTEYARDRLRNSDDPTLARFLDVFHHRMLSLFYRAWAVAQPAVQMDRPESDRFTDYVGSMLGIGHPALKHRDAFPDWAKLYFAGSLACQSKHAGGLCDMIREFFDTPVQIEEFVCRWIDLPSDYLLRVGDSPATGVLGETAVVGDRFWDCQQTFRVVLGPLTLQRYENFLPGNSSRQRLDDLITNYVGDELGWEIQLVLKKEEVPAWELGGAGQMGWTTWIATEDRTQDADEMILGPRRCVG